ncbi:cell division protein FtsZ [Euryarchaeota archaeon ex4484_178]|nr:MAG: cell division protein FtsZ [Euryarchaeota archaeon ex4484_178]
MSIESLIRRASAYSMLEKNLYEDRVNVVVVGVGGAGCNAITRMKKLGLEVPTIAINTDINHLSVVEADKKILLKAGTRGLGSGGQVEIGEKSAIIAREEIRRLFDGIEIVFIATGLGGGTGTGATPVISDIARREGALVITILTMPFKVERARFQRSREGLKRIMKHSNTVIILENDKLMEIVPNLPINKAFMVMDQLMSYTIMSFIDMITKPSLMNVDLSDLRTLMEHGELSTILIGEGSSTDPRKIVVDALNRPFVMDMDYSTASGGLIHITAGDSVPLSSVYSAVDAISSFLKDNSNIIVGARIAPEFDDRMRILVVLTGIKIPFIQEERLIEERSREEIYKIR